MHIMMTPCHASWPKSSENMLSFRKIMFISAIAKSQNPKGTSILVCNTSQHGFDYKLLRRKVQMISAERDSMHNTALLSLFKDFHNKSLPIMIRILETFRKSCSV